MLLSVFVAAVSLTLLFGGGWTFLNRVFYKDQEEQEKGPQVRYITS